MSDEAVDTVELPTEAVEMVIAKLEKGMQMGEVAHSHDEIRPSSIVMADAHTEAYSALIEAHPEYELQTEPGEESVGPMDPDELAARAADLDGDELMPDGGVVKNGVGEFIDDTKGAVFSDDRRYRYRLWRVWNTAKPTVAFLMLNPSTADETEDDPTIRRCLGYARDWGYGRLIVANLFAVRETDPANLYDYFDPIGPENDTHLQDIVTDADRVVAAWGTNGSIGDRGRQVAKMLDTDLYVLDTTKQGHPAHPLYQPAGIDPDPWDLSLLHENDDGQERDPQ